MSEKVAAMVETKCVDCGAGPSFLHTHINHNGGGVQLICENRVCCKERQRQKKAAIPALTAEQVRKHPEYLAMLANLTAVQTRCTELLDMYRAALEVIPKHLRSGVAEKARKICGLPLGTHPKVAVGDKVRIKIGCFKGREAQVKSLEEGGTFNAPNACVVLINPPEGECQEYAAGPYTYWAYDLEKI